MVQLWEITGGAKKGGMLVRSGPSTADDALNDRLETGSLVLEVKSKDNRLKYRLLEGNGPLEGWVAVKVASEEFAKISSRDVPEGCIINEMPEEPALPDFEPLPIALLFPGQGSQYVKMLEMVKDIPRVKEMLVKSIDILGYDILQICLQGPEEKLEETRYCQPALFIGGLAGVEKLRQENAAAVEQAKVMAGLSLGEYTALCAAGVFSFEDGLRLVKLRGEAMQEAAAMGEQLMLSVAGLEKSKLQAACRQSAEEVGNGAVCQIANELFPNGFACGGTKKAVEKLKVAAEKAGAMQARVLKTSGAFHTPMMQPAQDKLSAALDEVLPKMRTPRHTVWMNASAEPMRPGCNPEDIVALLKKQLTNPVLWEPSIRAIMGDGVTEFYECGPMKQIRAMMRRIDMSMWKNTKNIEV